MTTNCAWCGKPLCALEYVAHSNTTKFFGWHLWCKERDPLGGMDKSVEVRAALIGERGPGRIGEVQR